MSLQAFQQEPAADRFHRQPPSQDTLLFPNALCGFQKAYAAAGALQRFDTGVKSTTPASVSGYGARP